MHSLRRLAALLLSFLAVLPGLRADAPPAFEEIRKIDVHSHLFEDAQVFHDLFRRLNVRTVNVCVPGGDGHLATMDRVARHLYRSPPCTLSPRRSTSPAMPRPTTPRG
jgi:hypothetical protein